ncbi:MAG TPA: zinc ABC transporter substrate-binding protein [Dongiaceae bacterium]|nr:zinc ABC transporter substrate-binding protein [Dongiaceae bacterium]
MNRLWSCYSMTLVLLAMLLLVPAPSTQAADVSPSSDTAPYPLLASIRPIALLAQELTEGLPVQVDTLLPAGTSTHDFALSPSDLVRVRGTQLLVWLGPIGEPYLAKLIGPGGIDVRWEELQGVTHLPFRSALHDEDDEHDAHDEHHHASAWDSHLWWSIGNALPLARTLAQRIAADRPHWAAQLQQNLQAMELRLQQQLAKQRARLSQGAKPFLLAHDAFFYLEEDLGIRSEAALVLDPENRPGLQHLLELKQRVAKQQIQCVLTGAIVPDSLIDKIDRQPPLQRVSVDELGWDYAGARYSEWLGVSYDKLAQCMRLPAA